MSSNVEKIRRQFPALQGSPAPIYLDNACLTLKPQCVLDAIEEYYLEYPGCHGRSDHRFGRTATRKYERARARIARLVNASNDFCVLFTRNTTESINLVANGLDWRPDDEVVTSGIEHNSNLLPWQRLAKEGGIRHVVAPVNADTSFSMEGFADALSDRTRLVSMVHTSNLSGVTFPIEDIAKSARRHGALLLIDAAQSVISQDIDLKRLDVDFVAFSMHKAFGPTGTGVLCARRQVLEQIRPSFIGGETVSDTRYDSADFVDAPDRWEAGLQNYAGACGAGAAADFLASLRKSDIRRRLTSLNQVATEAVLSLPGVRLIGPEDPTLRAGILNVVIDGINPHEVAMLLDQSASVMVRAGYNCVHSWYHAAETPESLRASFAIYNTLGDVEIFTQSLAKIVKHFR